MQYDRDLKWFNRANSALLVMNGGGAILTALRHEWSTTIAFLIWFLNLLMWRGMIKSGQRTRDAARLTDAAISKVLEDVAGRDLTE